MSHEVPRIRAQYDPITNNAFYDVEAKAVHLAIRKCSNFGYDEPIPKTFLVTHSGHPTHPGPFTDIYVRADPFIVYWFGAQQKGYCTWYGPVCGQIGTYTGFLFFRGITGGHRTYWAVVLPDDPPDQDCLYRDGMTTQGQPSSFKDNPGEDLVLTDSVVSGMLTISWSPTY